MIKFLCACGKNLKAADESAGKKIKCPGCGKVAVVPVTVKAGPNDEATAALPRSDLPALPAERPADSATNSLDATVPPALRPDSTQVVDHDGTPKVEPAGDSWTLGGYRILRQLGEGGMGAVYEAEDIKLERHVALKVMKREIAENQQHRERFQREACAAASVESDFICPIFEVGEENGIPFIAMPFLKGEPLNEHWKKGMRLPIDEIVRIGKQVAEGLSAAHEAGLVHRDIKPGNIWLETQRSGPPRAIILDFGLARKQVDDIHITQSGAIVGTPAYMSPEQARGETDLDARTDLFSLGSVLYALCTGAVPFKGETTMSVLTALATKKPTPPHTISAMVPKPLSSLIMRLLAKKPSDRPQTAREVISVLGAIERDRGANPDTESVTAQYTRPTGSDVLTGTDKTTARPQKQPRTFYAIFTVIAVGLLSCFVTLAAGGVYYVVTDEGTIEIRTENEKVQVVLVRDGKEIEILDGADKKTWAVRTGAYTVRLKGDPEGLEIVMPDTFEMNRGDRHVVTIRKRKDPIAGNPKVVPAPPHAVAPFDAAQAKKHQDAWAKHLGVPVKYTNSLGMKFRLIPPGTFTMGSSRQEIDRCVKLNGENYKGPDAIWNRDRIQSEGPVHEVEITQPFYLGVTPVTVGQYRTFADGLQYRAEDRRWDKPGWDQTDAYPVVFVAWDDASEFCRWLSEKEGRAYRLPTEAEWELSCRAGTTTRFWFGDSEDDVVKHAWFKTNSNRKTNPVQQFAGNPFGLHDMHGNAWQWCEDLHDPNFYDRSPRKDPKGDGGGRLLARRRLGLLRVWVPLERPQLLES